MLGTEFVWQESVCQVKELCQRVGIACSVARWCPTYWRTHATLSMQVHAIVSRLIVDDGLPASHDQPTGTVVVHNVEPTALQVVLVKVPPLCSGAAAGTRR
jgi:hypothetical protein